MDTWSFGTQMEVHASNPSKALKPVSKMEISYGSDSNILQILQVRSPSQKRKASEENNGQIRSACLPRNDEMESANIEMLDIGNN
jgi:hypothetical protein